MAKQLNKNDATQRLTAGFYTGEPGDVARRLLGKLLVRTWPTGELASGIIVEVEAYLASDDPASHSFRGMRKRNASMFDGFGTLYVYTIHTRHCLNVVTEAAGIGSAVLIRALEPYAGIEQMRTLTQADVPPHRRQAGNSTLRPMTPTAALRQLTSGPGRLCRALQVDRQLDGVDLAVSQDIWIADAPPEVTAKPWTVMATPRIGISQGRDYLLRWFIDGNRYVSGRANEHSIGRTWQFKAG